MAPTVRGEFGGRTVLVLNRQMSAMMLLSNVAFDIHGDLGRMT